VGQVNADSCARLRVNLLRTLKSCNFSDDAGFLAQPTIIMKAHLTIISLAALVAVAFLPLNFATLSSIVSVFGIGCVLFSDYSRQTRVLVHPTRPLGSEAVLSRFRLAA
jgi:hypothetical protein